MGPEEKKKENDNCKQYIIYFCKCLKRKCVFDHNNNNIYINLTLLQFSNNKITIENYSDFLNVSCYIIVTYPLQESL